jgi:transcriptional regulatory protein GAL4
MDDFDEALPKATQACKECSRRRARCDKHIPQCSACSKFKRHCLYEKNSKTPLTRKHLTDVEARLEHAEAIIQKYRRRDALLKKEGEAQAQAQAQADAPAWSKYNDTPTVSRDATAKSNGRNGDTGGMPEHSDAILDDFSWTEELRPMAFGDSRSYRQRLAAASDPFREDEDDVAIDGMATLTLNEDQLGYLGNAAGASFLRHLWRPSREGTPDANAPSRKNPQEGHSGTVFYNTLPASVDSRKMIADPFIDAYFSLFHTTHPLIHEPSFRAAYSGLIPRPGGGSWQVLANIVAAIGGFTSMTYCMTVDTPFYFTAKAALSIDCLETGNITLVQTLILMAEYLQKRQKPNSAYTYAGLSKRMAFGLGLHRHIGDDTIPPLKQEIRRRLWWSLYVLDCGMSTTLSRPIEWINDAIDVALPLNIHEGDLTPQSTTSPEPRDEWTIYSALRAQARCVTHALPFGLLMLTFVSFYIAVQGAYTLLNSHDAVEAQALVEMDDRIVCAWTESLPAYFDDTVAAWIPGKFALASATTFWKLHNFRMIMFRSSILRNQACSEATDSAPTAHENTARKRCLEAARQAIYSVSRFWNTQPRTRLAAWHALYFTLQAVLIPLACLRQNPKDSEADAWRHDIRAALEAVEEMHFIHGSKCAAMIHHLADPYLDIVHEPHPMGSGEALYTQQTQVDGPWHDNNVSMEEIFQSMEHSYEFQTGLKALKCRTQEPVAWAG